MAWIEFVCRADHAADEGLDYIPMGNARRATRKSFADTVEAKARYRPGDTAPPY
jgi:hypothetical protein